MSSQGSSLDEQISSVFAKYKRGPPPKSSNEIESYQTSTNKFQTESPSFGSSGQSLDNQNTYKGKFNSMQSNTSTRSTSRDSYNEGNTSQQQSSESLSGRSPRNMDNYNEYDSSCTGYGAASADYSMAADYSESYSGNYGSDNYSETRGGCKLCDVSQFYTDEDKKLHDGSQTHCKKFLEEEILLGFEAFKKKYPNAIFGKEAVGFFGKAEYATNEQKQFFRAGLLLGFKCELCNVEAKTHTSWMDHVEGIKHALAYIKFLDENRKEEYLKKFPYLPKPTADRIQGARKKMESKAKYLQQKQHQEEALAPDPMELASQYIYKKKTQEKAAGGSGVPPLMFQSPMPPQQKQYQEEAPAPDPMELASQYIYKKKKQEKAAGGSGVPPLMFQPPMPPQQKQYQEQAPAPDPMELASQYIYKKKNQEKAAGGSGVPPLMFQPPMPPQSLIEKGGFNLGKQGGGGGEKKNQGGKKDGMQGKGGGQQGKGGQFGQKDGGQFGQQGGQYGRGGAPYGQQGRDQYGQSGQGDGALRQQSGPSGKRNGPYGQQSSPSGADKAPYGQQSGPSGAGKGPYGQQSGPSGAGNGLYAQQSGVSGTGNGPYGQERGPSGPSDGQYGQQSGPSGPSDGLYGQQSGPCGTGNGPYGQQSGPSGPSDGQYGQQSGPSGPSDDQYGQQSGPHGQSDGTYSSNSAHHAKVKGPKGNDFGPYSSKGGHKGRQNDGFWKQQNQGPGHYGNQGGNNNSKNDGLKRSGGGARGNNAESNLGGRDDYDAYRDHKAPNDDWAREIGEFQQNILAQARQENLKWDAERDKMRLERERVLQEVELERKKFLLEQEVFKKEVEARKRGLIPPEGPVGPRFFENTSSSALGERGLIPSEGPVGPRYFENTSSSALGAMGWGEDRGLALQNQKEIMEAKMAEQAQQQQLLQQQMAAAVMQQQQEQLMQEQMAKQMQHQQLLAEQAKVKALNNQMAEMQKMMRELEDTQKMYQQSMSMVIEQQQKLAELNKLKSDMDASSDPSKVESRVVDTRVVDMEVDNSNSQGTSRGPSFPQYSQQRGNQFGQQSDGQFGQQRENQFSQQSGGQFSQQSGGQFSQQSGGQFSQQSGGQFSQEVDQYNDQSRGQFTHQSGGQSQQYLDQPATMARTIEQEQVAKYSQQRKVESRDPKKTTFEMSQGEQNLWGPEDTSFSPSQQFTGKSARNKRRAKEKPSRWRHEMGEMRKNLRVNTKQSPTERPRQLQGAVATLKASRGESIEPKNPPLIAGKMEKVGRVAENKLRRYLKYKEKVKERNEQEAVTGVKIPPLIDPTADLTGRPRRNPDGSMLLPTQPPSKAGVDKEALKEAIVILNNTVQQYIQHLLSNKEALAKMDRGTLVTIEAAVTNLAASLSQQDTGGEQQMPDVQRMMSALSSLDPKMLANLVSTEPQLQGINLQDMMKGLENMASQPM